MNRFQFSGVLKFLLGILLAQGATLVLYVVTGDTGPEQSWILFSSLSLLVGFFAALWFASIADHLKKDAVARIKEDFTREREKIRVQAEKEKNKVLKQSHQQIIKQTRRVETKASFKTGAALAGLLGFGALMLFTQFVTIGFLALSTAGGALLGYGIRARQDYLTRKNRQIESKIGKPGPVEMLAAKPGRPALAGLMRKPN